MLPQPQHRALPKMVVITQTVLMLLLSFSRLASIRPPTSLSQPTPLPPRGMQRQLMPLTTPCTSFGPIQAPSPLAWVLVGSSVLQPVRKVERLSLLSHPFSGRPSGGASFIIEKDRADMERADMERAQQQMYWSLRVGELTRDIVG